MGICANAHMRPVGSLNNFADKLLGLASALCALGFALFCGACGSSEGTVPQAPAGAKSRNPSPPSGAVLPEAQLRHARFARPDGALVVCRDLSGYFRDCGCSGQSGGVARFHGVTANAEQMHVMFVGRTITPAFSNNKDEAAKLLKLRANAVVTSAQLIWDALRHVSWIPDETEVAALKDAEANPGILDEFMRETPLRIGPLELLPKVEYVVVNGQNVQLPRADSRGREVLVFAWWDNRTTTDCKLNRTLGALVSLTRQGDVVVQEINRILGEHGRVWTYWLATLHSSIADDNDVMKAIDAADVLLSHAPEGVAPVSMPFPWSKLDDAWSGCGACHEQAYSAWAASMHRKAYKTLSDRRREGDLRCVTCHVQEFKVTGAGFEVANGHGAVTCSSCHNGGEPELVCVRCHTDATDPARKYAGALKSICPGDTKAGAGKCDRR